MEEPHQDPPRWLLGPSSDRLMYRASFCRFPTTFAQAALTTLVSKRAVLRMWGMCLNYCGWTKSCTTQGTMQNHCLLVFTGDHIILGFLTWCRISSIHVSPPPKCPRAFPAQFTWRERFSFGICLWLHSLFVGATGNSCSFVYGDPFVFVGRDRNNGIGALAQPGGGDCEKTSRCKMIACLTTQEVATW